MWSAGSPSSRCFEKPAVKVCGPRLLSTPSWLLQAPAKATGSREKQPTNPGQELESERQRHATPDPSQNTQSGDEARNGCRENRKITFPRTTSNRARPPHLPGPPRSPQAAGSCRAAPEPRQVPRRLKTTEKDGGLGFPAKTLLKQNETFVPSFLTRITLVYWRTWILTPGTPAR